MNSLRGGILNATNKEMFLTSLSLLFHHTSLDKVCSCFFFRMFLLPQTIGNMMGRNSQNQAGCSDPTFFAESSAFFGSARLSVFVKALY